MIWLLLACGEDCPIVDADGDGAIAACPGETDSDGTVDCDDNDPAARPGISETCDGIDNNCDGDIDEGLLLTHYLDVDGDGYGDLETATESCTPPSGYIRAGGDCDDTDPEIGPQATEVCDGIDNDCDGAIDDGAGAQVWYADVDEDGTPGETTTTTACEPPEGYYAAPDVWDCDDGDPDIGPHAEEVCDEIDNDCDGTIDQGVPSIWYSDEDLDGLGGNTVTEGPDCNPTAGYSLNSDDCDDFDDTVGETSPYPLDENVLISSVADMSDICPCYASISETLRIKDLTDGTDLTGLSCVEDVGELVVTNSDSLTSLDGLESLVSISGDLTLEGNDALGDLTGLIGVETIGGALTVNSNPLLTDLSALSSLTEIGSVMTLTANDAMTHIGLDALEGVGRISISDCPSFEEITSMTSLVETPSIDIEGCGELTAIELPALTSISGDLYLFNNDSLATVSMPALTYVGGELRLHWAGDVVDLNDFSAVEEIGSLFLWGNSDLADVTGLGNITLVRGNFTISQNTSLEQTDAEALLEAIGSENVRGTVNVSSNGP